MAFQRLRRALLGAALASAALLAACGGGSVASQLVPTRVVAFGDGMADVGQTGKRYTVNDGSVNVWVARLAELYGLGLTSAGTGGTGHATGNARVFAKPDAVGNAATPTVKEQIDAFLAGGAFLGQDLVVVNAGTADIVTESQLMLASSQSSAQARAKIGQAGTDLGAQVRRLVQAGAKQVVVVGPYNLGRSRWATDNAIIGTLQDFSTFFNQSLLISIVDLGANVLYVDLPLYFNLVTASPSSYLGTGATVAGPVCTSVAAAASDSIGLGLGQVSSYLCDSTTLEAGANLALYFFADKIYPAPVAHRLFGNYAYDKIRTRW
jgi:outer membrane lipase/esterase